MRARVGVIRVDTEAMADMIRDTEVMVMATTMAVVMETTVAMAADMITLDTQDTPTTTTVAMGTAMMLATVGAEVVAEGKQQISSSFIRLSLTFIFMHHCINSSFHRSQDVKSKV
uniref:Uncharacterized protein n=1 Tax=Timema bartmani TaxID=61472 RepID=A0A7R9F121_9NEOP|nr:unnamed protein product [Timema bartmani]